MQDKKVREAGDSNPPGPLPHLCREEISGMLDPKTSWLGLFCSSANEKRG